MPEIADVRFFPFGDSIARGPVRDSGREDDRKYRGGHFPPPVHVCCDRRTTV